MLATKSAHISDKHTLATLKLRKEARELIAWGGGANSVSTASRIRSVDSETPAAEALRSVDKSAVAAAAAPGSWQLRS